MPIDQVSVTAAHALQQLGHVFVDVRSAQEFAAGHPVGAVNVPLFDHDEDTGQMGPNPDFVRVIRANFPPATKLILSCQAGMRSLRAAQVLASFGYEHLTDVPAGFGGTIDRMNGRPVPGWAAAGLPVETTTAAGASYTDLLKTADAATA